ncbi:Rsn1 domain-containing protein [Penicillium ucsense]|uniref:Rsn1 domain-containing protein n=1 Tax=Penicillium ucsense TaxID=2839758 RepID=A0A8J8W8T8_9EURO|nr:Rsn1 domain-containing protein [Penicillium ucsense]KAF7739084.1 Rsn1 domain-containing protein [Penicillium ucsense]
MSSNSNSLGDALSHAGGNGKLDQGVSLKSFLASLATATVVFAVEFLLFMLLKSKLTRIYQPRTYLVPDRERTEPSPPGLFRWVGPVFRTSSSEFIQKCGLDAYFFLRFLRMLLKIFIPMGFLILPILLPLNRVGGKDTSYQNGTNSAAGTPTGDRWNVTGLDQLAWGNVKPEHTSRYWAHCVLAVILICYVCAIFFDELRGYIRMRQAYLTSPQHRLRASATTVLVTAIPHSWLTIEALDQLFDVFPGGVRNIWINRNFDDLNEKVKERNDLALRLEAAETELIIKCKKAALKRAKAEAKKAGKSTKEAKNNEKAATDQRATQMAMGPGISSGDPHQARTLRETLHHHHNTQKRGESDESRTGRGVFDPAVAVAAADLVGHGVGKLGKSMVGGFKKVEAGFDSTLTRNGGGLVDTLDVDVPSHGRTPGTQIQPQLQEVPLEQRPSTAPSQTRLEGQDESFCRDDRPVPQKRPSWKDRMSSHLSIHSKRSGPEPDEFPLTAPETPTQDTFGDRSGGKETGKTNDESRKAHKEGDKVPGEEYPIAYNENFDQEDYGEPLWKQYIKEKDQATHRLPIFGWKWMPSLLLIGKKVNTIDHCRKELARLNLEIEIDQQHPEKFPLMNSAFIQFNHQVAAHMACQSVAHHVPKQMAPRIVEISPDDVIWDNMSMKWWERYLRTFGIITLVVGMVLGWAFPVAFTGLLSQLSYLEGKFSWLAWLGNLPQWLISAIQGVLPALFLAILVALLPLILRFLSKTQGLHTGMAIELTVQNYYFAFLFVQLFLVVTIASSASTILNNVTNVTSWPELLATNIPRSSNYFFSYMILQAMSVSAGALVQIVGLISWFILAPILDSTARSKWARTTNLNQVQWGTFFPLYTTLACIGLIYSVVAPLIMVFNIITFSLFWFVYRYNTLYVTKFRFDTGGLLFPRAINQLFTGLYFMEVCLIGLFFLVRDTQGAVACKGQAIVMIIVLILTIGFQILLNEAFGPLIRYLPITLEDDAVKRDQEFHRAQLTRLGLAADDEEEDADQSLEHRLAKGEQEQRSRDHDAENIELRNLESEREDWKRQDSGLNTPTRSTTKQSSWAERSPNRRSKFFGIDSAGPSPTLKALRERMAHDTEAQGPATNNKGHALFAGIHDELEDLTPDERDQLVQRAFQHEALRAKRPVIWIPRDDLGISDDEVYRTQRFSKHIWISNEYQALDGKGRTIFSRSPPDFSEVDLIQL